MTQRQHRCPFRPIHSYVMCPFYDRFIDACPFSIIEILFWVSLRRPLVLVELVGVGQVIAQLGQYLRLRTQRRRTLAHQKLQKPRRDGKVRNRGARNGAEEGTSGKGESSAFLCQGPRWIVPLEWTTYAASRPRARAAVLPAGMPCLRPVSWCRRAGSSPPCRTPALQTTQPHKHTSHQIAGSN